MVDFSRTSTSTEDSVATPEKIKSVFEEMKKHFVENAVDQEITFYFSLGEGPGEKWTLKVTPSACEFKEGKPEKDADCFLKTSSDLFIDMITGKYTPGTMDFMRGKIKSNDPFKLKVLKDVFAG